MRYSLRLIQQVRGGCGLQVNGAKVSCIVEQTALIVLDAIGAYDCLTMAEVCGRNESVLCGLEHSWLGTRQVEL